jgi:hypothetical protein
VHLAVGACFAEWQSGLDQGDIQLGFELFPSIKVDNQESDKLVIPSIDCAYSTKIAYRGAE